MDAGLARLCLFDPGEHDHHLVLLAIFRQDPWVPRALYPFCFPRRGSTAAVAPIFRWHRRWASAHRDPPWASRREQPARSRSDIGEFRKRYKWMALAALLAFFRGQLASLRAQVSKSSITRRPWLTARIRRVVLPTTRGSESATRTAIARVRRPSYDASESWRAKSCRAPARFTIETGRPSPAIRTRGTSSWRSSGSIPTNGERSKRGSVQPARARRRQNRRVGYAHPRPARTSRWNIVAEPGSTAKSYVGCGGRPCPLLSVQALAAHTLGYVAEIDSETLAKYKPPGFDDLPLAKTNGARTPSDYEAGDTGGRDGSRARVGSPISEANGDGEKARRRRQRTLSIRPRGRPLGRRSRRSSIPFPDATSGSPSTRTSSEAIDRAMRPHWPRGRRRRGRAHRQTPAHVEARLRPERSLGRRGKGPRPRSIHPPLRRLSPPDARQEHERRVPTRIHDEAVQRARRPGGPPHRARAHREVRRLRHLRTANLSL